MFKYAITPDLFQPTTLDGKTIKSGSKLYIFTDLVAPKVPLHFGLDGVFQTRNESQPPYEYLGTGVAATFTDGTHRIDVKDATGVIVDTATFTVGSTNPPPTSKTTVKLTANLDKVEIVTVHNPDL